jgi:hypothetical protein
MEFFFMSSRSPTSLFILLLHFSSFHVISFFQSSSISVYP